MLGNDQRSGGFPRVVDSTRHRARSTVGAEFDQPRMADLKRSLSNLECNLLNVDDENIRDAFIEPHSRSP